MPAAVGLSFESIIGYAAAGIAEFFWRCAFITVTGAARTVPVLLSTRAGVFGFRVMVIEYIILIIAGCVGDWFCHGVTCNFCVV